MLNWPRGEKKLSPMPSHNLPYFSLGQVSRFPATYLRSAWLSLLINLPTGTVGLLPCPHKATSPEEAQLHHTLPQGKSSSPNQPGGSLLSTLQLTDVPLTPWSPELHAVYQVWPSKCQAEATNHFHQSTGSRITTKG